MRSLVVAFTDNLLPSVPLFENRSICAKVIKVIWWFTFSEQSIRDCRALTVLTDASFSLDVCAFLQFCRHLRSDDGSDE